MSCPKGVYSKESKRGSIEISKGILVATRGNLKLSQFQYHLISVWLTYIDGTCYLEPPKRVLPKLSYWIQSVVRAEGK